MPIAEDKTLDAAKGCAKFQRILSVRHTPQNGGRIISANEFRLAVIGKDLL